jgi:hypothetical protein
MMTITAHKQNMINAKLPYITLKLDEVYIAFFIGTRSTCVPNGERKITALESEKMLVIASVRLPIEYRMS